MYRKNGGENTHTHTHTRARARTHAHTQTHTLVISVQAVTAFTEDRVQHAWTVALFLNFTD